MKERITRPPIILILLLGLLVLAAGVEAKKVPPARPVDLNSASVAELEDGAGASGPSTAQATHCVPQTKSSSFRRARGFARGFMVSASGNSIRCGPYVMVVPLRTTKPQ